MDHPLCGHCPLAVCCMPVVTLDWLHSTNHQHVVSYIIPSIIGPPSSSCLSSPSIWTLPMTQNKLLALTPCPMLPRLPHTLLSSWHRGRYGNTVVTICLWWVCSIWHTVMITIFFMLSMGVAHLHTVHSYAGDMLGELDCPLHSCMRHVLMLWSICLIFGCGIIWHLLDPLYTWVHIISHEPIIGPGVCIAGLEQWKRWSTRME